MRALLVLLVIFLGSAEPAPLVQLRAAISENDPVKVASLLAGDNRLASARTTDGQGPAWWAIASGGHAKILGLLLSSGAQIISGDRDKNGRTALELLPVRLTDAHMRAWAEEAERAGPVLDVLKRKLIRDLEHRLASRKALASELDSLDDE